MKIYDNISGLFGGTPDTLRVKARDILVGINRFHRIFLLSLIILGCISCGANLEQRKQDASIHYRLGVIYLNERNYVEALKELTQSIDIYPGDPASHNALGLAYFARGMNNDAIKEIKKSISLDPKFSEAHVNLSAVYIVERRWDDVISESKAALGNIFYKTPETAYVNMGWASYNKGDYMDALESFKKAVEMNPEYPVAYYDAGLTYEKMNNMQDAVGAYQMAIKKAPDYVDAYYSLGLALIKQRENAGAMKAFEKVMELAPDSDRANSAKDYIKILK